MNHKQFMGALDQERIVEAIGAAEQRTSGEIRVHVQPKVTGGDMRTVAEKTFERLGMTATAERNGVLLFIASEDHAFVILGDSGIDSRVPPDFWAAISSRLSGRFQAGEFTLGIVEAVGQAGEQLAAFFPRSADDVDELPNEIDVSD